ncbi:hypothetical protein Tco_0424521 [Tanacetum coccineum]
MDLIFAAGGDLRELSAKEAWETIEIFAHRQKEWDKPFKEVEETLGTQIEVEPLDQTKIEDVGLDICNHDIHLSSRKVSSFDEPEPQPQPLPSYPSLDESIREERGYDPPTKLHSLDSLRMKVIFYEKKLWSS